MSRGTCHLNRSNSDISNTNISVLVLRCYVCAESYSQIIKVVLRKSPSGFGMTMSGFDPVFIGALLDGNFM